MRAAKSNAVLRAKQLTDDILIDVGGEQQLCVAEAGSWLLWDDEKGFRCFVDGEEFSEKWLVLSN